MMPWFTASSSVDFAHHHHYEDDDPLASYDVLFPCPSPQPPLPLLPTYVVVAMPDWPAPAAAAAPPPPLPLLGAYNQHTRAARLDRYRAKRRALRFNTVKYSLRSQASGRRCRVKGRFVKSSPTPPTAVPASSHNASFSSSSTTTTEDLDDDLDDFPLF